MVGTPGAGKEPCTAGQRIDAEKREQEKKQMSSTSASRLSGRGLRSISVGEDVKKVGMVGMAGAVEKVEEVGAVGKVELMGWVEFCVRVHH